MVPSLLVYCYWYLYLYKTPINKSGILKNSLSGTQLFFFFFFFKGYRCIRYTFFSLQNRVTSMQMLHFIYFLNALHLPKEGSWFHHSQSTCFYYKIILMYWNAVNHILRLHREHATGLLMDGKMILLLIYTGKTCHLPLNRSHSASKGEYNY
jgi:hypothetical protein